MTRVKEKTLVAILILCMIFAMMPSVAKGADNTDSWDGTTDTSWYKDGKTSFDITSAEALAGVSKLAKEQNLKFAGVTFNLVKDIDLNGKHWVPIKNFSGTFNGNNHKILNMKVEEKNGESGFFGYLSNAQVKNLDIEKAEVIVPDSNTYFNQGVLAGWANGSEIINCGTSGAMTVDAGKGTVPAVAGFIGSCKGNTKLTSCWSTVDVKTTDDKEPCMVGGLVGQWENAANGAKIIDCYFGGSIAVAEATTSAGGILGAGLSFNGNVVLIKGCVSYGKITTPYETAVQIAALDEDGEAVNCIWMDNGQPGVIRLIVDWSTGTAYADPNFDEMQCGNKVKSFDESIIADLNSNIQGDKQWTLSVDGYPVFSDQVDRILADYKLVEVAKSEIPKNLNLYTQTTVEELTRILNGIDYHLTKDKQAIVDGYVLAIREAISKLEYKQADYSKVDVAIAKAGKLNKDNYKDFSSVEKAIKAVVRDKNITEQEQVDAMALSIEKAIGALEYKPADYSKVDAAIAKAEKLNKDEYKDFSYVDKAIAAVVGDKNITEQEQVDAMALAIEKAIGALEYKSADYSKVDAAIAKAEKLNKDEYKDFSYVDKAIAAVVRDKNITEQEQVDAMALAIEGAILALEYKPVVNQDDGKEYDKKEEHSPVTGDEMDIALLIVLAMISSGIGIAVYSKKRKE